MWVAFFGWREIGSIVNKVIMTKNNPPNLNSFFTKYLQTEWGFLLFFKFEIRLRLKCF